MRTYQIIKENILTGTQEVCNTFTSYDKQTDFPTLGRARNELWRLQNVYKGTTHSDYCFATLLHLYFIAIVKVESKANAMPSEITKKHGSPFCEFTY